MAFVPVGADSNSKDLVGKRTLIIMGVTTGLLVLLMACILIFFLWRMWKRMNDLRQIQEGWRTETTLLFVSIFMKIQVTKTVCVSQLERKKENIDCSILDVQHTVSPQL